MKTKTKTITILAVEDCEDDQFLMKRAFGVIGVHCAVVWANNGAEAIAYLKGEGQFSDRTRFPYPTFLMTDLKMPSGDGFAVLQHLKTMPEQAIIPTAVFSASVDPDDIKRSYLLGASSYIAKRGDFSELCRILKLFCDYWLECERPAVDSAGKQLPTESKGKLGERFLTQDTNEGR